MDIFIEIMESYADLFKTALRVLMPFITVYQYEAGFSSLTHSCENEISPDLPSIVPNFDDR